MDYRLPPHALRPRVTQRPKISPAHMKPSDSALIQPYIIGINKETKHTWSHVLNCAPRERRTCMMCAIRGV
jgi:hypothetical protein